MLNYKNPAFWIAASAPADGGFGWLSIVNNQALGENAEFIYCRVREGMLQCGKLKIIS